MRKTIYSTMTSTMTSTVMTLAAISISAVLTTGFVQADEAATSYDESYPELQAADEALKAGEFRKMSRMLHQALRNYHGNALVKETALNILDRAYEIQGDRGVPNDNELPLSVEYFGVQVNRNQDEGSSSYRLDIKLKSETPDLVQQLKITRYPEEVILDKNAGLGSWETWHDEVYSYGLKSRRLPQIPTGLYYYEVEVKDVPTTVTGWFIIDDRMHAEQSPAVSVPQINQVFNTTTPRLQFEDYRSSYYRGGYRAIYAAVFDQADNELWRHWQTSPRLTELTVTKPLAPGEYWFYLQYSERRKFGVITMGRSASQGVPFRVTP